MIIKTKKRRIKNTKKLHTKKNKLINSITIKGNNKGTDKNTINNKFNITLFIFRRDYRVKDNTTLLTACKQSRQVIPVFIFTHTQIDDNKNKLKSHNCVKFLVESLEELNHEELAGSLRIYYGNEFEIIKKILKNNSDIDCIAFNRDYTAYSKKRDAEIERIATSMNRNILNLDDALLFPLASILTSENKIYTKYTPYYRNAIKQVVRPIDNYKPKNIVSRIKFKVRGVTEYTGKLSDFYDIKKIGCGCGCGKLIEKPGRKAGLEILKELSSGKWNQYEDKRNILTYNTTHLSPYNKFGCVSIREVYEASIKGKARIGQTASDSGIIAQLIWRDFFYNLSAANPEIYEYSRNGVLNRQIKWLDNSERLKAWKEAKTGYPIVDACMRELNTTGYLHNRGRLIVSNFLVRILQQNWHEGEYHFARVLYDYDPAQNSFGWQIAASISGTESRPISQMIYNPWIQSKKFDANAKYIKKWLPELIEVPANHLHQWDKYHSEYNSNKDLGGYPAPIVDYAKEREYNLKMIK